MAETSTAPLTGFTPERAARYVADAMPPLLERAAANLGEPDAAGALHPDPNARAARLALLSAAEVLDQLGPLLAEDVKLPQRAALARLEALFVRLHPDLPLAMPKHPGQASSLAELVGDAWEAAEAAADAPPAPPAPSLPGVGLPARGAGLDL